MFTDGVDVFVFKTMDAYEYSVKQTTAYYVWLMSYVRKHFQQILKWWPHPFIIYKGLRLTEYGVKHHVTMTNTVYNKKHSKSANLCHT